MTPRLHPRHAQLSPVRARRGHCPAASAIAPGSPQSRRGRRTRVYKLRTGDEAGGIRSTRVSRLGATDALWAVRQCRGRFPVPVIAPRPHCTQTLPRVQFQVLLTLSRKDFSSVVHTTSSLSVFWPYLNLAAFYLPFKTALPNSPTRGLERHTVPAAKSVRGFHTLWRGFYSDLRLGREIHLPVLRLQLARLRGDSDWLVRASLAATERIVVTFFSSAY